MLDVFGFPTPQGANYQEFYGGGCDYDWIKPRGASMVRMMLIGAGGGGSSSTSGGGGGGSACVTQWIGPAIFIPDVLRVSIGLGGVGGLGTGNNVGTSGTTTYIRYQAKNNNGYILLAATQGNGAGSAGTGGAGGTADSNNYFGAAGIYKAVGGQAGANTNGSITASSTTFLSGGAGGSSTGGGAGGNVATNYGYPTISGGTGTTGGVGRDGFFITQPILLGVGGAGGGGGSAVAGGRGGNGGIGCGGGGGGVGSGTNGNGGRGGDGAVFIWSW